jgi:hypothetical protein
MGLRARPHSRRTPKTQLPIRLSASCRPAQIRDRQLVTRSARGRRATGNYRRGAPTRPAAGWEVLPSGRILNLSAHQASATPAEVVAGAAREGLLAMSVAAGLSVMQAMF